MTARELLSVGVGVTELIIALVVVRHLGRFGRSFPWLAALMIFFALRGADRIYVGFAGDEPFALGLLFDGLLLLVVTLLALTLDKTIRALGAAEEAADYRQEEYARALRDYRRLLRHRVANPLTAILGSAQTLRELRDLDAATRDHLLDVLVDEVVRLQHVALEPTAVSQEEETLSPRPKVAGHDRALCAIPPSTRDPRRGSG
jgi:signal transduction histidine kinase